MAGVGKNVRRDRELKGISQEELAFDADLHRTYVTQQCIGWAGSLLFWAWYCASCWKFRSDFDLVWRRLPMAVAVVASGMQGLRKNRHGPRTPEAKPALARSI